jgi:hypothetical protein
MPFEFYSNTSVESLKTIEKDDKIKWWLRIQKQKLDLKLKVEFIRRGKKRQNRHQQMKNKRVIDKNK